MNKNIMNKSIINNNLIIIFIIIILTIYFLKNDNEIFKEHIDTLYSHEGDKRIKNVTILVIFIVFLIIYYIASYFESILKINRFIFILFVIILLLLFIEYKLQKNVLYSNIENSLDEALEKATTGDFLLFRSYHTFDIPELFFFRYMNAIFSPTIF